MAQSRWRHTPFLTAVAAGDIDAAETLEQATPPEGRLTERDGGPAIVVAAGAGQTEMVRWLLGRGAGVEDAGRYGRTALIAASEHDRPEVVRVLLGAGARLDATENLSAALRDSDQDGSLFDGLPEDMAARMSSTLGDTVANDPDILNTASNAAIGVEVAQLLVEAGADPVELDADLLRAVMGADQIEERAVSPAKFSRARHPREGRANPEEVSEPFWEQMIRTGCSGYIGHQAFGGRKRPRGIPAVWCHDRFGMTTTRLPDGRWVQIAGEHEDFYDPDFHIYNDVVVHDGRGGLRHFLYPEAVFPPTDCHTATLVGERILLIGNLSYVDGRRPGETQVLSLSIEDFSITPVATSGSGPGWISGHRATLVGDAIRIEGGEVWTGEVSRPLEGIWRLSLSERRWSRH